MKPLMKWLMFLAALLLAASAAHAAIDPAKVQKLLAGELLFGYSVSVSGDTAVLGALFDDGSGSAYVFVRAADGTWSQQAKLTAADRAACDNFGSSVALSMDTAVIGARFDDDKGNDSGSAYVFVRAADGTWSQQAKLTAADGAADDVFGWSVAVCGDIAVIGTPRDDDQGDDSGSAYVFVRAADGTWLQQDILMATTGHAGNFFGTSVALSGDTMLIGAPGDDAQTTDNDGAVYVFVREPDGTWLQQDRLTAADGAAYDNFGSSVALSMDTAVIGARFDDDKGNGSGSAYVFVRRGDDLWMQQAKLAANDGADWDEFGASVSVSGDTAVIGAYGDDDKGDSSGSAYVFVRAADGTWSQQAKLTAPDGAACDMFGWNVAVSGDTAVIGAWQDDDKGEDSGSAYVFVRAADGTWPQSVRPNMAPIYKLLLGR